MDEQNGLDELPPLHLHLAGSDGKKQTILLEGAAYIIETEEEEVHPVEKTFMGMPVQVAEKTGNKTKVCAPAFGEMDMQTEAHGPVWILGSPLFYDYTVNYELNERKPALAFTKAPCGCGADSLISQQR